MAESKSTGESLLELGRLYYSKCDFGPAEERLIDAADEFRRNQQYAPFLRCQNMLLRIYAEREDEASVNRTKDLLQDMVLQNEIQLNAKTHHALGSFALLKGQLSSALEYFRKSLAMALAEGNQEDMCYAINSIAICYMKQEKYAEALKEVYNLKVFFQVVDIPEVRLASEMLNAIILRNLGKYDESLQICGECFDLLKTIKSHYLYVQLLYTTGMTHFRKGDLEAARFYIQLCRKSIDATQLKAFCRDVDKALAELGLKPKVDYDIVFNPVKKKIVERRKGPVDLKNQFILVDLLNLFVKRPGEVYSKEQITERLWNEKYDPSVHDNKIYVTIKRLRQLIEPDSNKPRYIFRAKTGYYLNKDVKVVLEN